jgi:hypothetical protein
MYLLMIFYIMAGVFLTYKYEWLPFKEKGYWIWRSWILFFFGVLFWLPVGIALFISLLKKEKLI